MAAPFQLSSLATDPQPFHTSLLVFSLPHNYQLTWYKVKVKVKDTLQLAVYSQSDRLGVKPLEIHDQNFFPTEPLR
jgi:hypothetical protein